MRPGRTYTVMLVGVLGLVILKGDLDMKVPTLLPTSTSTFGEVEQRTTKTNTNTNITANTNTTANITSLVENKRGSSTNSTRNSTRNSTGWDWSEPFVPWKSRRTEPIPCIINKKWGEEKQPWNPINDPLTQRYPADAGLLYVKLEKAASTTLASVAARTAIAVAERTQANNTRKDGSLVHRICEFRGVRHVWAKRSKPFRNRDHSKSFLWTFLKKPTKLYLSMYFFFRLDWKPEKEREFTEESFIQYFNNTRKGYDQADKVTNINFKDRKGSRDRKDAEFQSKRDDNKAIKTFVRRTITDYDFIGLVERMDESLVLLSIMLDLEVTDVLYSNAKLNGGYIRRKGKEPCRKIGAKRPLLPEMQNFLDSPRWAYLTKLDNALYDAVNRSLDATIDLVGRDVFDAKMKEFTEAKEKVTEYCKGKIVLQCTPDGKETARTKQSICYSHDVGCGHECVDELYPVVLNKDNKSIPLLNPPA